MPISNDDLIRRRRKLLKGAVGAPVLFTLPVGSALAATSLTCDIKSQQTFASESPSTFLTAPSADKWMRARLDVFVVNVQGSGPVDAVMVGSDFYRLDNATTTLILIPQVDIAGTPSLTGSQVDVLVDYNVSGMATVVVAPNSPVSPIAGVSCWNSLNPTAPLTSNIVN